MQEPDQCLASVTQNRKFIDVVFLFAEKFYTGIPGYEICVVKLSSNKYLGNIHRFYSREFRECSVEYNGWAILVSFPADKVWMEDSRSLQSPSRIQRLKNGNGAVPTSARSLPARAPASKIDPLLRLKCGSSEIPSYGRKISLPTE